jgi:multicomponent Na+:H+ antiporter subunit D
MLIGVLGAVAQTEIRRILSFHIVSQIGYMILGLGLFSVAGLAGGILYILHHIVVKTALFCVAGIVEHTSGTGKLSELAGTATRAPLLALLFALPALSLAGVPPFSGFVAKLALAQAAVAQGRWVILAVSLLVGLLTLFSMAKIWAGAFWGARPATDETGRAGPGVAGHGHAGTAVATVAPARSASVPMLLATSLLVVLSLGVTVFAGPLYAYSSAAAQELLEPSGYIAAVLRR